IAAVNGGGAADTVVEAGQPVHAPLPAESAKLPGSYLGLADHLPGIRDSGPDASRSAERSQVHHLAALPDDCMIRSLAQDDYPRDITAAVDSGGDHAFDCRAQIV